MEVIRSSRISIALFVLLSWSCSDFGTAIDTITSSRFIRDPETIVSSSSTFSFGFFSPGNSRNRYVGIWFTDVSPPTVIWVANRNKPLKDSSGIVTISDDGNIVVLDGQKEVLWSSNVSKSATNNTVAQLLDSGNLVLQDVTNEASLWESFQEPTDTFLQTMKVSTNLRTGERVQLTSWKSPSDPSTGRFSAGVDPFNIPQVFIWNDNKPHWRSGPWNGRIFLGVANMTSVYLDGFTLTVDYQEGIASFTFAFSNMSIFFSLNSEGKLQEKIQDQGKKELEKKLTFPGTECEVYGTCGAFGSCNVDRNPICNCLRGFEPKYIEEWNKGNWTRGCVRRRPLQCDRINKTGDVGKEDGFLKLERVKLPDFADWTSTPDEDQCRGYCLKNCSCIAYAFDIGIGCMTWNGNLIDIQKMSIGGADLHIRLAHSELDGKDYFKVIIIVAVILGTIIFSNCTFFSWRWLRRRRAMKEKSKVQMVDNGETSAEISSEMNQVNLPVFNFEKLATATNSFHLSNKLGQGGFGPVYEGVLEDGQKIAVKRLSKASGQGLQEFMNEVLVISKLQHRSLVRLLGCCVEGKEKMLIYEYMPNKSLDAFLFDPLKRELLDWGKRFNIIEGISRGLLYLHRDSRLRIIHRDLKASNILLDEELNPKISDFGMARIFGGNQNQANTVKVVGTYGYMSPEYAMAGLFSEKSDIFSFGVLLLEIVSGKRNSNFHHNEHSLTLLGYGWKLWNEDNVVTFIDSVIYNSCFHSEIFRCIQVGLLCVQEHVKDRPTMSTVISMLNSEIVDLPAPKQPAFADRQNDLDTESSELGKKRYSINDVTVTIIEGR